MRQMTALIEDIEPIWKIMKELIKASVVSARELKISCYWFSHRLFLSVAVLFFRQSTTTHIAVGLSTVV